MPLLAPAALLAVTTAAVSTPTTASRPTPARWHLDRRKAILAEHPEVRELIGKEPLSLPLLAATNAAQVACAVGFSGLPGIALTPLAILVGGTLSLWQFTLLHDVLHGTAALPKGVRRNDVLFAGSLPSLFGYFLYLRYGHMTHHKAFGVEPIQTLFDSDQADFEDGDALFVAHRQRMSGDGADGGVGFFGREDVGGLGISISRTIFSLAWLGPARSGDAPRREPLALAAYHASVFALSMTFERAALVFGGGVVPALVGRNFFFPSKPPDFHATCATYARASLALALALYAAAGPGAIAWLFWAEVGWQLPLHPASAMFVSNHPSLDAPDGAAGAVGGSCQPTASVYLGEWYDWLCCFSNYHTEHHDFPDVPAFRLRDLRDAAPGYYSDEALAGCRDGWLETMRRTFERRDFYACSGVGEVELGAGSHGGSPAVERTSVSDPARSEPVRARPHAP